MQATAAAPSTTPTTPALRSISIPPIGAPWHGGVYAGIVRGEDGAPDYHLVLGPEAPERLTWSAARAWAAALDIDGHNDFTLPTRREQSLLLANAGEHFQPGWYWSDEQFAGDEAYAWIQYFDSGSQYDHLKSYNGRARAVRRVKI